MTEPQPEQTTPESEQAAASEPDPATADTIKRQWDESLWHRAPTARYRP
jgi:hypothetical protein